MTYIPHGYTVIGTCSECGGPVAVPTVTWSTVAPVPTCLKCGAVQRESYGPTIPMRPRIPLRPEWGNGTTSPHFYTTWSRT